jgi:hypothetical protein
MKAVNSCEKDKMDSATLAELWLAIGGDSEDEEEPGYERGSAQRAADCECVRSILSNHAAGSSVRKPSGASLLCYGAAARSAPHRGARGAGSVCRADPRARARLAPSQRCSTTIATQRR